MTRQEALADLAERLDMGVVMARGLGWNITADRLISAAGSIRWQLQWEAEHPRAESQAKQQHYQETPSE